MDRGESAAVDRIGSDADGGCPNSIRTEPAALPVLRSVLALLHRISITNAILDAAAQLPDPALRSLDAIHLATAEELAPALTSFVAYDRRLAEAARSRGLPVVAPAK